tara:strand:- start:361 stop:945 length:585 start_codon:yes stop_codon:yes gene_type:complete
MTTLTSPLNRQPDKLDYSSPTQFRFMINQLPKVQFFTTAANIPDISLGEAVIPTPFKNIPLMGDKLTYGNLEVSFIVDEFLENYITIHNWLIGIGFPKSRTQFSSFRSDTSNNPTSAKTVSPDTVGAATPDRGMYSDATLTILSNKNNPLVEVRYSDIFPVSLSALSYSQDATDVTYQTAEISFRYKLYEIVTL